MSLLIMDVPSILVSSYFGNLPNEIKFAKTDEEKAKYYYKLMKSSDGKYTNAIYPTLKIIMKILKNQNPSHIAFVFDKTRNTFRRTIYPEYKGNRGKTQDPLKEQFEAMKVILKRMGFVVLESDEYEADDLAATLTKRFEQIIPTYVMSKDHDYYQLASDYTKLWMVQTKEENVRDLAEKYLLPKGITLDELKLPDKVFEFTKETVFGETGVMPEQIPDLKGILGDKSDNIPGIKGIAAAAPLLITEYGTLENIYEVLDNIGDDKTALKELVAYWKVNLGVKTSPINALLREKTEMEMSSKQSGLLSKRLATMITDIPIEVELEDLIAEYDHKTYEEILNEYEFTSLKENK